MAVPVRCSCGHFFTVEAHLTGGYVNCPGCGKATPVPGLRDPFWRAVQVVASAVWMAAVVGGYVLFGAPGSLIVGVGGAALLWLLSRTF